MSLTLHSDKLIFLSDWRETMRRSVDKKKNKLSKIVGEIVSIFLWHEICIFWVMIDFFVQIIPKETAN
jgi:hypothetical protein